MNKPTKQEFVQRIAQMLDEMRRLKTENDRLKAALQSIIRIAASNP